MNIFETIETVTSRIEPYHSQFLADALTESLARNPSLFDKVWSLMAPNDWPVPASARIKTEVNVQGGRIDICVYPEGLPDKVIAIEVKTVDDSTEPDQLSKYFDGLKKQNFRSEDIQLVYLTPFNADHAGDKASLLPTVREFEGFKRDHPEAKDARHVSWLDVASIPWDGNALWEQHRDYVCNNISSQTKLREGIERNRSLADFFGQRATEEFRRRLNELHPSQDGNRLTISLSQLDEPQKDARIVHAIEALLGGDAVVSQEHPDNLADDVRQKFLDSEQGDVHRSLFKLSSRFPGVWIQGKGDYGVRIAHKNHRGGVSALRSDGTDRLLVYLKR